MKTIIVFDVPAINGGALSVLEQYYKEAMEQLDCKWIFVLSKPKLTETHNVKVLNYSWVKKSWFHRLFFDYIIAPKIVSKYKADEILSLQNTMIPLVKIAQTVLIHNALPFSETRFSFLKNLKFWVYQNLIRLIMKRTIKKANKIIVQTEWMKKICIKETNLIADKVIVKKPFYNIEINKFFEIKNSEVLTFFYPADAYEYKNHKVIVEAAILLKNKLADTNYQIIFTLNGNEDKKIVILKKLIEEYNLPIKFIGKIPLNEVYEYYSKSVLLFPSYIETVGMPLLEAMAHRSPILAANCDYAYEILKSYKKVKFFDPHSSEEVSNQLMFMLKRSKSL